MKIQLAFFKGGTPLGAGIICCEEVEKTEIFDGAEGYKFVVTCKFEDPACPVFIECTYNGENIYRSACRFGVESSLDWESIDLSEHTLIFKRHV